MARPALTGLFVGDAPEAWEALGFTVDGDHVDVGGVRITLTDDGTGLRRWALDGVQLAGDEVEGLRTERAPAGGADDHPNGIVELDHVVVWTPDVDRTVGALSAIGLEKRRERETDSYGGPMRQAFFKPAGGIIEVVGSAEPQGDGRAKFFGLDFTSADLDATAAYLVERLKPAKDAVQPGRRIATLRSDAGAGVPIAIMSPHPTDGADDL